MNLKNLLISASIVLFASGLLQAKKLFKESIFLPGVAYVKVSQDYLDTSSEDEDRFGIPHIDRLLGQVDAHKLERTFPDCLPAKPGGTDLSNIYTVSFPESVPVKDFCYDMSKLDGVEYCEPWYIYESTLDHNDTNRDDQYGLDLCRANDAHDLSTGDPSAIVAIVDSGIDIDHPDLAPNIWINLGEDINDDGVIDEEDENNRDDDGNGKRDDFYGWDYLDNDGNPNDDDQSNRAGHGTHCAGIASAKTNNNRGVASVGYNCTIMPIRTGEGGFVQYGYQGIEYAVRAGAGVVSCSWGGYQRTNFGENIINSAYENDVLVLCATGNDNTDELHYPSGYENCVAVSSTDANDRKSGFSNYGDWVDISAPGSRIASTFLNNRYVYMDGTSMACPFAASVAVLIRAALPMADVDEVRELLLEGADNIDEINRNYEGELGAGRINAYQSLVLGQRPAIVIEDLEIVADGNGNGHIDAGEEVDFVVSLNNFDGIIAAEDVVVTMSSPDLSLEVVVNRIELEDIEPGEATSNEDNPFTIDVSEDAIGHTTFLTVTVIVEPDGIEFSKEFELIVGQPDILIVDDDDGRDAEQWYFRTVEQMNRGWQRWNIQENQNANPNDLADLMLEHNMVIWATGNSEEPLDEIDKWTISVGIADGANILLVGNRIGDDDSNSDLLLDYFGAEHTADSVGNALMISGLPDSPIDAETSVNFFINRDRRLSPSGINPVDGADSLLVYLRRPGDVTGVAGVFRGEDGGDPRTAYLGFTFETLSGTPTDPNVLLEQIYTWMIGEWDGPNDVSFDGTVPFEYALEPAFPNPFNSTVRINYSFPEVSTYRLAVFNSAGRETALINSGQSPAGQYQATWDAIGIPSGVYFIRLTSDGQSSLSQKITLIK